MNRTGIIIVVSVLGAGLGMSAVHAQAPIPILDSVDIDTVVVDGSLHAPAEILKLLDLSPKLYMLAQLADSVERDSIATQVLPSTMFVMEEGESIQLVQYEFSDSSQTLLTISEAAFETGDYDAALAMYREIVALEPEHHQGYTMLGNAFYMLEQYDSAAYYFRRAIELNPISYQAHWFLADALWHLNDTAGTLEHITRAHLYNVNHANVRSSLEYYREAVGRPWDDWSFIPQVVTFEDTAGVHVAMDSGWFGYGLVVALWDYEPNYAEQMLGENSGNEFARLMMREREAIANSIAVNPVHDSLINPIIQNGDLELFITYELIAPQHPTWLLLVEDETIGHLVEYLNRYH